MPSFSFFNQKVPNHPLSFGEQLFNYIFFFLQIQASRKKGLSKGQYFVLDKINIREHTSMDNGLYKN